MSMIYPSGQRCPVEDRPEHVKPSAASIKRNSDLSLWASHASGASVREIAKTLGLSKSYVHKRISLVRKSGMVHGQRRVD